MCNVYVKTFFFLNPNPHKQYISKKKHKNNGSNFPLLPFRHHSSSLFYVFSSSFRRDDEPEGNASTCTCYPFVNGCRETVSGNSLVTMSPPPPPPTHPFRDQHSPPLLEGILSLRYTFPFIKNVNLLQEEKTGMSGFSDHGARVNVVLERWSGETLT